MGGFGVNEPLRDRMGDKPPLRMSLSASGFDRTGTRFQALLVLVRTGCPSKLKLIRYGNWVRPSRDMPIDDDDDACRSRIPSITPAPCPILSRQR